MTLYLKNATWYDPDTFLCKTTTLAVEEGAFGGVTLDVALPRSSERPSEDRVLDCTGKIVTRSFGCGHHHIYSALARGMPAPSRTPTNFLEILELVWWRMDKKLDHDMIEASALVTGLYCAKNGVTFIIDHHASPFAIDGSLETIAKALDRLGLGHLLCYEISCRDGDAIKEQGLAETDAYLSSGRKGHVGLHASFTVDDDLLGRAVALAHKHNTGIHIHVAEGEADQAHCMATYGKRVVTRLHEAGVLDMPQSILGHCVRIDSAERAHIAHAPCWVVQNTESNLNNNVGLGRYNDLRVMLGTDGMHSDMLRSAQAAYFLSGHAEGGMSPLAAYQRFRAIHQHIATHNAPGDTLNNLVVLNYDTPTPLTADNFPGHFCYAFAARHVETVISQGRVIVDHQTLVSGDEQDILAYANEQAARLWALLT
ncbi:MAG: amidohydrolase family protein [Bilophila sp.]